jgi:D-glycero-D-manno-heptose 1,7-bisphosphate phosphatase
VNRAAFLDRDGVINEPAAEGEYITRWEDFRFLPGTADAVAQLNQAGYRVVVVTNQRCVAKKLLSIEDLESMHGRMRKELATAGAIVDEIYYCPHDYAEACDCRKPLPGMILEAARTHQIDLAASWMIGDSEIDMAAGRSAGCRTARILKRNELHAGSAEITASSLLDAVRKILAF